MNIHGHRPIIQPERFVKRFAGRCVNQVLRLARPHRRLDRIWGFAQPRLGERVAVVRDLIFSFIRFFRFRRRKFGASSAK